MPRPVLCLAPLQGLTDAVYRNTFSRFFTGLDVAVTPFISTIRNPRIKDAHIRDVLPENNTGLPLVPQIMSKSPADFINLARRLFDLGYQTVNWNLGCPFPMVAKKGRGSGMLPYPDRIDEFLETVIPALPGSLSIKTRLGRYTADEMDDLMPVFNRYPLSELIIHPRTGVQRYEGAPDLDAFAAALSICRHPVVYNGDIRTPAAFQRLSERFPAVHRWMIGRGVLANPLLPARIRAIHAGTADDGIHGDAISEFRRFHDALFAAYGERLHGPAHLIERMKGFWYYFGWSFADSRKFIKSVHKTRQPAVYTDLVQRFFDETAQWAGEEMDCVI